MSKLYRGQGPLMMQIRNANGTYGPIMEMGAVAAASFSPTTEELKHRESFSGKRAVDKVIETTTECTVAITVENFDQEALAVHLRSDITSNAGGPFTDVAVIPDVTAAEVGSIFRVPGLQISGLLLSDSSPVPVALVEGTHFEAISSAHGFYRLLSKTGLAGAIKASGDRAASTSVKAISKSQITAKIMFLGINTAADGEPSLVEAIVSLKPASSFSLIGDEFGTYEIAGECLFQDGGFFRVDGIAQA